MKLRIAERDWLSLCERLFVRKDVETAGLLLAEAVGSGETGTLVVKQVVVLDDSAYRIRKRDQISLDPIALNRLTRVARDRGWSVFTIHTHPGASEPWFSGADDAGDERFMPALKCQIPNATHGSIVVVESRSAIARTFDEHGTSQEVPLVVVGRTLESTLPASARSAEWFARQELALGARGQAQLRALRVGIVGLGGTGSLVALQLAHLGVGALVLVDADKIEASNLSRVVGASKADIGETFKVDVAARYARSVGLVGSIESRREALGSTNAHVLGACDIVVSCVDRHTPRSVLNRLAYRYLVPTIDLGTAFRVDERGTMTGNAGRVVVVGPGRPCLACWGHLDPHALRIEALSKAERSEQERLGYIDGAEEPQPSVIAFNAAVASAAVTELLRMATGFAGAEKPPLRLAFDFAEGTVRRNSLAANSACGICGDGSAAAESATPLLASA